MNRSSVPSVATAMGIASAVGYTAANLCLRSVTELDPVFVSECKTIPTLVAVLPWVAHRIWNGKAICVSWNDLGVVVAAGLFGQLAGNVAFQWSLGCVGLAMAVPLTLGTMIISGAILGHVLLGDRLTRRMVIASGVLILAIVILSVGAAEAHRLIADDHTGHQASSWALVAAGVGAACLAGLAYCSLGLSLRFASNRGTSVAMLLFIVSSTGLLALGGIVAARDGWEPWQLTTSRQYWFLWGAGVFNLLAFAAITKALQLASVAFVNVLNASQTAMAAVAGVVLFGEALTPALVLGVVLTIGGLVLVRDRPRRSSNQAMPPGHSGDT